MINNKRVKFLAFLLLILCTSFLATDPRINSIFFHGDSFNFSSFFSLSEASDESRVSNHKTSQPHYPFRPGEELRYGIYSTVLKVGLASITYKGREKLGNRIVDIIVVEAKAPGFHDIDTIYGVIENFTPLRVERKINLFGENVEILEEYNQLTNEVIITRKGKKTTVKKLKSNKAIGNVILLLYYFRLNKRAFNVGDKLEFNLPTKNLEMRVDKYLKLKVPKGKFNALFIRSIPKKFKVWLDPQQGNIPLRIQGAIGFGNTYLALIDIENPH